MDVYTYPDDCRFHELNKKHFSTLEKGRSMVKRNGDLFKKLKSISEVNGYPPKEYSYHDNICIITDDNEKEWLKFISPEIEYTDNGNFDIYTIKNIFTTSCFYYNRNKYIIISGLDSLDLDREGFELEAMNAGIFTLFSSKGIIKEKISSINIGQLYDSILAKGDEQNKYIEMNDIECFFESAFVFKINPETAFYNLDLYRMSSYISLSMHVKHYNDEVEISDLILDLIKSGESSIDFSRLSKTLIIKDEPYFLFMELYRMLERIYAIPAAKKLQSELSISSKTLFEIAKGLEDSIGWRKNEKAGLLSLLGLIEFQDLMYLYEILNKNPGQHFKKDNIDTLINNLDEKEIGFDGYDGLQANLKEKLLICLREYIYMSRNSHVHYREALSPQLNDRQVLLLCKVLLLIINQIYIKVGI